MSRLRRPDEDDRDQHTGGRGKAKRSLVLDAQGLPADTPFIVVNIAFRQ
jgi:hypothetical protein